MTSILENLPSVASDIYQNFDLLWQEYQAPIQQNFYDGVLLVICTLLPTLLLELWSIDTARALYQKNARLYKTAVSLNLFNHIMLGLPGYVLVSTLLAQPSATNLQILSQIAGFIVIHSTCFYNVHKFLHSHPKFYKWHKFHHLFNTHVPPVAANAVSPVEYFVGYMLPFLLGVVALQASAAAFWWSVQIISLFNIVMHTPPLEQYYDPLLPSWMVSTGDHLEHHKRLNCHYAAPTLDLDYLVGQWNLLTTFGGASKQQQVAPTSISTRS